MAPEVRSQPPLPYLFGSIFFCQFFFWVQLFLVGVFFFRGCTPPLVPTPFFCLVHITTCVPEKPRDTLEEREIERQEDQDNKAPSKETRLIVSTVQKRLGYYIV